MMLYVQILLIWCVRNCAQLKLTKEKSKKLPVIIPNYVEVSKTLNTLQPADPLAIVTNVHRYVDCLLLCKRHLLCVSTSYFPERKYCLLSETALKTRETVVRVQSQSPFVSYYNELMYKNEFGSKNPKTKPLGHGRLPSRCGTNLKDKIPFLENRPERIVDGWTPEPYHMPWIGLLIKDNKVRCTSFIVSKDATDKFSLWVLTAKHCLLSYTDVDEEETKINLKPFGLLFGVHDLRFNNQHMIYRTIATIHFHPEEGATPKDLALIRMNKPIKYNSYINGLCLPEPLDVINLPDDAACKICGFGATQPQSAPTVGSNILQCIEVHTSNAEWDLNSLFTEWKSVLKLRAPGFGPFNGDSGGPIFCHSPKSWSFLIAVVTGGQSLGWRNTYLTAARISYYMKFITDCMVDYNDICCPN